MALPVALFLLVPLGGGSPEAEISRLLMGLSLLVGVATAVFLFRKLLSLNPAVTFRRRLVLLAIIVGLELVVWPGIWVFAIPADPLEKTLWNIAAPHQPPVADIAGAWDVGHWTGLGDGSFKVYLDQRPAGAKLTGVLTSPTAPNHRRWTMQWVLAHSALSGDEVRLHFRPQFPFFWSEGLTYVGTVTKVGPDNRAEQIEGKLYIHSRRETPWIYSFRALREQSPNRSRRTEDQPFLFSLEGGGGQGWVRTIVGVSQWIYSPPRLTAPAPTRNTDRFVRSGEKLVPKKRGGCKGKVEFGREFLPFLARCPPLTSA